MTYLAELIRRSNLVEEHLTESGGEITPEVEIFLKIMTDLKEELPRKIDLSCYTIERLETLEAYWKEKADSLYSIAKGIKATRERAENYIKGALAEAGWKEALGYERKITVSKIKDKIVIDESALPGEFFKEKITKVPDRDKIERTLLEGFSISGVDVLPNYSLRKGVNKKRENGVTENE